MTAEKGEKKIMSQQYITNRNMQKNLFRRRLWVLAVSLLLFFVYYVAAVVLALVNMRSANWTRADMQNELLNLYGAYGNQLIAVFPTALGVLTGIEGFSFLDRKKELTFYESLPVSRAGRFWNIVVNSFFIYIVPGFVMMGIGLLLTGAFGAGSGEITKTAFEWFVRSIFLFFSVYASASLAVMLTGNIIVAILAECVFLGYEPALDLILSGYSSTMFRTYVSSGEIWTYVFSPLALGLGSVSAGKTILLCLLDGTVLIQLAFLIYLEFRRNEDAGKAVLFAPVRWGAKAGVAFLMALLVGLIAYGGTTNTSGTASSIVAVIITAVIVGGIMETIYNYNVRAAMRHASAILAAAGCAVLVFCGYRFDLTGFDSWIPKAGKVESAYLYDSNVYYTNHYLDNGEAVGPSEDYFQKYMRLDDLESVNAVLKAGEDAVKREKTGTLTKEETDGVSYMDLTIGYRMKNGKIEQRAISLPMTKENNSLMDQVVGSEKFKEGYFQIYHDGFVEKELEHTKISYWNGSELSSPYSEKADKLYAGFKKAYLKDLQKFNFTLASGKSLTGEAEIIRERTENAKPKRGFDISYPVYSDFTNTIEFLKENGLYQEPMSEKEKESHSNLSGPFVNGD